MRQAVALEVPIERRTVNLAAAWAPYLLLVGIAGVIVYVVLPDDSGARPWTMTAGIVGGCWGHAILLMTI